MKEIEENIEEGRGRRQVGEDVEVGAVIEVFQVTHDRDHRQGGFDQHPLIPSAFGAQLEIGWHRLRRAKAQVGQDNRATFELGYHRMKVLVGGVERCSRPIDHLPPIVDDPAQSDTDRPTGFIFRLTADLLGAATLTNREKSAQLDSCRYYQFSGLNCLEYTLAAVINSTRPLGSNRDISDVMEFNVEIMTPIDDYLKKVETSKRAELERIRALAKETVPSAEEAIVYGMPTLKYQGKPFLGFDAHKNHIGIYPYSGQVIEELKDQLHDYGLSSGAIRVPLDKPISESILKQVINCRLKQIEAERKGE